MRSTRWIGALLVFLLTPIHASRAQLPLSHERYLIRQVEGSYTCDIRAGECRAIPPGILLQLEWQGTAYQTTLADDSPALVDPYCQFVDNPGLYLGVCPYDPQLETGFWAYIGFGTPYYLQPTIIDEDFDQDGIEGEKGYTYFYGDNAFYLIAYRPDGVLKYVAYRTDDPTAYLYVIVVQVEVQGGQIGFVAREEPMQPRTEVALFPTPAREQLTVALTLARPSTVTLTLYDLLGRPCWQQTIRASAGTSSWIIPRGNWPSGLYLLRVQFDGKQLVQKVLWQ